MSDFVDYEPRATAHGPVVKVGIRPAQPADVDSLASVMAVRGGTVGDGVGRASRLIEQLDVLLVAETDGALVGWCGIQKCSIFAGAEPEWLVAGLTVIPEHRRRGIAARLLRGALDAIAESVAGESIFSVINARNLASIDLHKRLGFVEVGRAATFAGIDFTGGVGVLLRCP